MKWPVTACVLAACLLMVQVARAEAPVGNAQETALIEVALGAETFSVYTKDAPLNQVLYSLALKAGFPVTEHPDLAGDSITIDLEDVTWREGIAQLLRGWSYALVIDQSSASPKRLILIAKEKGELPFPENERTSPTPDEERESLEVVQSNDRPSAENPPSEVPQSRLPASNMEEAIRISKEMISIEEDPVARAIREVEQAAAREMTDDAESAERYVDSLRALDAYQDPRLLDVLVPAIASGNSAVRSAALSVMRHNPVASDSPTLNRVYQMATSDPDSQVRRDALEVYVRYGDPVEVLSAMQSLGRDDGPTRDIAVREWIRLEQERAEDRLDEKQLRNAMGQ